MTKLEAPLSPLLAPGLVVWFWAANFGLLDTPAGPLTWLINVLLVRRFMEQPNPIKGLPCISMNWLTVAQPANLLKTRDPSLGVRDYDHNLRAEPWFFG